MEKEKLQKILENHKLWLRGDGGERADLSGEDLKYAPLGGADLSRADLRNTYLENANLTGASLVGADLSGAFLTGKREELSCAIGDEYIDRRPYSEIVEIARDYIQSICGFEKFAEWGLIR